MKKRLGDDMLGITELLARAQGVRWPGAASVRPTIWGRQGPDLTEVPMVSPTLSTGRNPR